METQLNNATSINALTTCDPYCDCHRRCSKCGKLKTPYPYYPYGNYPYWNQYPTLAWGGTSAGLSINRQIASTNSNPSFYSTMGTVQTTS